MALTDPLRNLLAASLRATRFKGQWRVGRLLNHIFAPINPEVPKVHVPEVGWLRLDLRDHHMLGQTFWVGLSNTDRAAIELLNGLLHPDSVFVDVGANVGVYTLALARHLARGAGRVICFEPNPTNFRRLNEHIEMNELANITAENVGISDEAGELEVAGTEHPGNWSLISVGPQRFTLTLTTLDAYFAQHPVKRLDAIKMDIEGVEPRAIRGGRATIERHRPIIAFEANPSLLQRMGSSIDELLDLIQSLGYRLYDEPPEGLSLLQPIRDRSKLFKVDMTNLVAIPTERSRDVGEAEPLAIASLRRS